MSRVGHEGVEGDPEPLAIVDAHYGPGAARAAMVVASRWTDATGIEEHAVTLPAAAPYVPGRFHERELPAIVAALRHASVEVAAIVIDGYVLLDEHGKSGLGARLHAHFDGRYAIVGVAKTAYRGGTFATPVLRGTSKRPLFVTALGISADHAAALVTNMHGTHRIPTLLRRADQLARGIS